MDLRIVEEFNTVALYRNMSIAARMLNTSQSTLSRHLTAAEKELGCVLVKRIQGSHTLELTKEGEIFQQKGIELLNIWNDLGIKLSKVPKKRTVTMSSSMLELCRPLLSYLLGEMAEETDPLFDIKIKDMDKPADNALRDNKIDIALVPYSKRRDMYQLTFESLTTVDMLVVIHENDPILERRDSLVIQELQETRVLASLDPASLEITLPIHDMCNERNFSPTFESYAAYNSIFDLLVQRLRPGAVYIIPAPLIDIYQFQLPFAKFVLLEDASIHLGFLFRSEDQKTLAPIISSAAEYYSQARA